MDNAFPPRLVDHEEGANILLDKPILLLGRHQECDIQLNSRKVSRRHCCIAQVNEALIVRDLASTNGIRINGEKVTEGKLHPGDELIVGNFHFKVQWDGHPLHEVSATQNSSENQPPALAILEALEASDPGISCEQPIALPESPDSADNEEPEDLEKSSNKAHEKENSSRMEDQPPSIVLPDQIDLASSDEFHQSP